MKTTTPTIIVVMILRVQERISQVHESMFHFARRDHGLEGNAFVSKIAAIFADRRVFLFARCENLQRGYDNPCRLLVQLMLYEDGEGLLEKNVERENIKSVLVFEGIELAANEAYR